MVSPVFGTLVTLEHSGHIVSCLRFSIIESSESGFLILQSAVLRMSDKETPLFMAADADASRTECALKALSTPASLSKSLIQWASL